MQPPPRSQDPGSNGFAVDLLKTSCLYTCYRSTCSDYSRWHSTVFPISTKFRTPQELHFLCSHLDGFADARYWLNRKFLSSDYFTFAFTSLFDSLLQATLRGCWH